MTNHDEVAATEQSQDEAGGEEQGQQSRSASLVPRIPITSSLEIDLIREQLENHGRVVITKDKGVHVPDRSVSLMTRALRVPRVPRSSGPTHFTIPRHVDRSGAALECTTHWDPVNWRTRAAKPQGTQAILLAKPVLRHLPEKGQMDWEQIEECLAGTGCNGVYEPLAVAVVPSGQAHAPRPELYSMSESGSSGKRSRFVDTVASVFKREKGDKHATVSEDARNRWAERLSQLGLTKPYIIAAPFALPEEGVHDWALERCAEVLRHALEWRGVETIIPCASSERGKAERLRIIAGNNVSHIICDVPGDELAAAVAGARAVLATPGNAIHNALQLGTASVCIMGPQGSASSAGTEPHLLVRASGDESRKVSESFGTTEHGCLEGLEAGPVARALSKVLVHGAASH